MFPIKEFEKRFHDILDCMDTIGEDAANAQADQMDELNANFEDALFVIECIDETEEDWREAFVDALEEMKDLCAEYRKISELLPALGTEVERLERLICMAESNLE